MINKLIFPERYFPEWSKFVMNGTIWHMNEQKTEQQKNE